MAVCYVNNLHLPTPTPGVADQSLTVSTTALELAAFNPLSQLVLITVSGAAADGVSVTFDGSTPTASNGHVFLSGYNELWTVNAASAAQFIRSGSADVTVHASEFTV